MKRRKCVRAHEIETQGSAAAREGTKGGCGKGQKEGADQGAVGAKLGGGATRRCAPSRAHNEEDEDIAGGAMSGDVAVGCARASET